MDLSGFDHPYWAHESTHFVLEHRDTGDEFDAPTGRVICARCGHGSMAVDDIRHALDCPYREFVGPDQAD